MRVKIGAGVGAIGRSWIVVGVRTRGSQGTRVMQGRHKDASDSVPIEVTWDTAKGTTEGTRGTTQDTGGTTQDTGGITRDTGSTIQGTRGTGYTTRKVSRRWWCAPHRWVGLRKPMAA